MADSQQSVEQQVTSQTPATKQKNPKRVASGKAIAQRTKMAREAQKKALIKAQSIIAKKQADPPPASDAPSADPPAVDEPNKNVLTTTQWLSVISIVVSLAGIYYKREEIKALLTKKPPQDYTPPPRRGRDSRQDFGIRMSPRLVLRAHTLHLLCLCH